MKDPDKIRGPKAPEDRLAELMVSIPKALHAWGLQTDDSLLKRPMDFDAAVAGLAGVILRIEWRDRLPPSTITAEVAKVDPRPIEHVVLNITQDPEMLDKELAPEPAPLPPAKELLLAADGAQRERNRHCIDDQDTDGSGNEVRGLDWSCATEDLCDLLLRLCKLLNDRVTRLESPEK